MRGIWREDVGTIDKGNWGEEGDRQSLRRMKAARRERECGGRVGEEWEWSTKPPEREWEEEPRGSTRPWPQAKCATDAPGVRACVWVIGCLAAYRGNATLICTSYLGHLESPFSLKTSIFGKTQKPVTLTENLLCKQDALFSASMFPLWHP